MGKCYKFWEMGVNPITMQIASEPMKKNHNGIEYHRPTDERIVYHQRALR